MVEALFQARSHAEREQDAVNHLGSVLEQAARSRPGQSSTGPPVEHRVMAAAGQMRILDGHHAPAVGAAAVEDRKPLRRSQDDQFDRPSGPCHA